MSLLVSEEKEARKVSESEILVRGNGLDRPLSKAAIFGDERTPRTKLTELNRASLRFEYELLRGDKLLATGYTCHGCVEFETGRPSRLPKKLYALRDG